jgi:hypothetical protein
MTDTLFDLPSLPRPELPKPRRERWQPLRLGLVELFHYDSEEFWFRDGRLLLRGNNGTGKSKVLSLTLPFLFDAQLRPSRVEPDGDPGKKMAWNLLINAASATPGSSLAGARRMALRAISPWAPACRLWQGRRKSKAGSSCSKAPAKGKILVSVKTYG